MIGFWIFIGVLVVVLVLGSLNIWFDDTPDPRWSEPVTRRRAGCQTMTGATERRPGVWVANTSTSVFATRPKVRSDG